MNSNFFNIEANYGGALCIINAKNNNFIYNVVLFQCKSFYGGGILIDFFYNVVDYV